METGPCADPRGDGDGWGLLELCVGCTGRHWEVLEGSGSRWVKWVGVQVLGGGSIFWIGFTGQGLDPRLGVQVLNWGLSAGGCLGLGWGSGVQVTGGDPGRDLGPRGNLGHRWRSGSGLDCGVLWPRVGSGSHWGIWVLGCSLGLGLGSGTQVGSGFGVGIQVLGGGLGTGLWVQGEAPGRVLDAGNGSGSWVGVQVLG